jgi:chromatin remodeling complex protein RSC6
MRLQKKKLGWRGIRTQIERTAEKLAPARAVIRRYRYLRKMSSSNTSAPSTMNTTTKKVKKAAAPEVAAPAPAPVAAATPATTKTTKAKTSAPAPVAAPVAAPAPVPAADAASATSDASLGDEVKALRDQLTSIRDAASAALSALKRVEKRASAEVKEAKKSKRKPRVDANGERLPSNFEIPVPISDELSAFLGGPKNNKMARKDVTTSLNKYINSHNLRTVHTITPDAPLRKLLRLADGESTDIFRLQKLLKPHYPKPANKA